MPWKVSKLFFQKRVSHFPNGWCFQNSLTRKVCLRFQKSTIYQLRILCIPLLFGDKMAITIIYLWWQIFMRQLYYGLWFRSKRKTLEQVSYPQKIGNPNLNFTLLLCPIHLFQAVSKRLHSHSLYDLQDALIPSLITS